MALAFDDSCQLDGGLHYLFAKWAWTHHELWVGVWSRPLYTALYSFPAPLGYRTARLFTVLICLVIAWQTWRLAEDLQVERAPWAVALLWLQPSFFLFCADNMTEPVFALVYVLALRLHHRGSVKAGMLVASLTILARPEGLFLALLWGVWVAVERRAALRELLTGPIGRRLKALSCLLPIGLLATGAAGWWLAALIITGDPLFIKHNWPSNWGVTGAMYGTAGLWGYPLRLPEVVGPLLLIPFLCGLFVWLRRGIGTTLTSSFLVLFILHTILRAYGLFSSAGYPRYLVVISPAIAIITLAGWNELSRRASPVAPVWRAAAAATVLALSAFVNLLYADGAEWSRDARALSEAHSWFRANPQPIDRMVWAHPYAAILFDRDPWENPEFTHDRERDRRLLRDSPAKTLVVWDERVGPKYPGLHARDFEEAGFTLLYSRASILEGYLLDRSWFGYGGPRAQVIYLFYKQ